MTAQTLQLPTSETSTTMASLEKSKPEHKEKKKKKSNDEKKNSTGTSKETKIKKEKKAPNHEKKNHHSKKIEKKTPNGTSKEDAFIVPSSSSDSQEIVPRSPKSPKVKAKKRKEEEKDGEEEDGTMLCRFPMARIKRIMKIEDPDMVLGQDVVFLVNKATEKFLEQFCEESYECSVQDRKKSLGYKHLSTVISKRRRYDFLSDFIPEKLKAEDALAQIKIIEAAQ